MTTSRPTTTELCAVLDAEAATLRDWLAAVELNRAALLTGTLRDMRVAAEYVRDLSVAQRGMLGPIGEEAVGRHPQVVEEIDGIIAALRDERRGGGAP